MQRNDLMKNSETIIRVLRLQDNKAFVIDCFKRTMPKWVEISALEQYEGCTESELLEKTNMTLCDVESLEVDSQKLAHERYTMVALVLPFVDDIHLRREAITRVAESLKVSKQTIRYYLCLYLAYQDISALATCKSNKAKELTEDEKNMRWALNKFFYTKNRMSLQYSYKAMLGAKYCDASGKLLPKYPTINQFRYFYRKYNKLQTYYISREGVKSYQRNNRPLLGEGVQDFAPTIGTGMLDSTICDIYLVNEEGALVGRPILTACVDAYSGLCCGYALTWEGGLYNLRSLMLNVIADKVGLCQMFGISITQAEWNCSKLPGILITDKGSEYKSETFAQIAELGVTLVNLPPYRPELKGVVEKFFDVIQNLYKPHLKGKGVIEPDFQERGAHDYRKDACLTMREFETVLLRCIIYYNAKRIVENFPYSEEMISAKVQPHASSIWNWGMEQPGANLISANGIQLMFILMPRTTGKFTRKGLIVNKLRYRNDDYVEMYLKGGEVTVAYNPDDVSGVWLIERGRYTRFELIESRFTGKDLTEVQAMQMNQKDIVKAVTKENLQAKLDLAEHISAIVKSASKTGNTNIKNVRNTRKKEQNRTHINHMKGGTEDE